ncbi:MAG: CDP-2,3-bis-(O-geranylgeranyl)-sn-glycerol synthase [Thermoproteota archaeon]|nr:MAG: CDP-2,3-bis-(O-geranylgeranyl)-sn-glycerol synthase [Candidatus Korarchaeota archaeon]RLG52709.1 MAG: CDP-2,3-bis-(O-geranylgeranyl)-sn-glycerol synthase [Candidatus Korarchaeota archaeon]
MLATLARALWIFLPAYVSNMAPVIFGGGKPVDLGKRWLDGRPIFGSHKTIRGLVSAWIAGWITGLAIGAPEYGALAGVAASLGDLLGSFIKRRMGIPPGEKAPFLIDQLDFMLPAAAVAYAMLSVDIVEVLIAILITPVLHVLTNTIAYLLGLKPHPW